METKASVPTKENLPAWLTCCPPAELYLHGLKLAAASTFFCPAAGARGEIIRNANKPSSSFQARRWGSIRWTQDTSSSSTLQPQSCFLTTSPGTRGSLAQQDTALPAGSAHERLGWLTCQPNRRGRPATAPPSQIDPCMEAFRCSQTSLFFFSTFPSE